MATAARDRTSETPEADARIAACNRCNAALPGLGFCPECGCPEFRWTGRDDPGLAYRSNGDDYARFLARKGQLGGEYGFEANFLPPQLYPFQAAPVERVIRRGRGAILAGTGLGKTIQELTFAENVVRHTNRPVLILAPLAVSHQTEREAVKFGIEATCCRDGQHRGGIVLANYERLHHFDPDHFAGVVCDEAGALKSYSGATRKQVTRFMSKVPYRLLATATPAPNDFVELGTLSEALGELSYSEMLRRFFRYRDDKDQKREARQQDAAERVIDSDPSYYKKLAYRVSQTIGQWRLKHHAVTPFWRWVCSWAMAYRKPSDLGFDDGPFLLPPLNERVHVITPKQPSPGMLFPVPAFGMHEERQERRRTLAQRCEFVADLVRHDRPAICWCHMNDEGDLLEKLIPDAAQIAGRTPDDRKEELYRAFLDGQLRTLILKPKIGAWGLNFQHCAHVVTFPSHSWEQHHQLVRRCWRYGQKSTVRVDVVATEGEVRVLDNLHRKADQADRMFEALIEHTHQATRIEREDPNTNRMEAPKWLRA